MASAECWALSAALAVFWIAPAALPSRAISHNLRVPGDLGRQSGPLKRLQLRVVTPALLFEHAMRVCRGAIGRPKALADTRVPISPFFA